jgi:hypothetical protein
MSFLSWDYRRRYAGGFSWGSKVIIGYVAAFPLAGWWLMRVEVEATEFGRGLPLTTAVGRGVPGFM